jgi:hypothetical protein
MRKEEGCTQDKKAQREGEKEIEGKKKIYPNIFKCLCHRIEDFCLYC